MIDKCSCGATCSQVEKLQAEIERLKAQAEYHFESQREDYNRLEDTLVANDDLNAEIEQLNAELDYSADYANKQQAEIVRLRKVLSFITTYGDSEHFSAAGFAGFALKEQGE